MQIHSCDRNVCASIKQSKAVNSTTSTQLLLQFVKSVIKCVIAVPILLYTMPLFHPASICLSLYLFFVTSQKINIHIISNEVLHNIEFVFPTWVWSRYSADDGGFAKTVQLIKLSVSRTLSFL